MMLHSPLGAFDESRLMAGLRALPWPTNAPRPRRLRIECRGDSRDAATAVFVVQLHGVMGRVVRITGPTPEGALMDAVAAWLTSIVAPLGIDVTVTFAAERWARRRFTN